MEHISSDCNCSGKKCNICQQVKCIQLFLPINSKKSDPVPSYYCRPCNNERKYAWARNNPQKCHESHKRWRQNNPGSDSEYQREYYRKHRGRYKKSSQIGLSRTWKENNPGRHRAHKARERGVIFESGDFTREEWDNLKRQYDFTCLRCGRKEPDIKLTPDHIIPISKGGANTIDNIQPLCPSCNSSKHAKIIDFRPKAS